MQTRSLEQTWECSGNREAESAEWERQGNIALSSTLSKESALHSECTGEFKQRRDGFGFVF